MDEHEAAGIIFFGLDASRGGTGSDLSGKPLVVLAYLSFGFVALVAGVAFAEPPRLPLATLPTPAFLNGVGASAAGWPPYACAAAAVLGVGAFGCAAAARRATHLRTHNLLHSRLAGVHFVSQSFNLEVRLTHKGTGRGP
jgi:hypothetical protein